MLVLLALHDDVVHIMVNFSGNFLCFVSLSMMLCNELKESLTIT